MSTATLPVSLKNNPRLSKWLQFDASGVVNVRSGKVELGQGIATALAQIVAQELGVSLTSVRMCAANTAQSPDEGMTAGSLSVMDSGAALRYVCAQARSRLYQAAIERFNVAAEQLELRDGTLSVRGAAHSLSYWDLADSNWLEVDATDAPRVDAVSRDDVTQVSATEQASMNGRTRVVVGQASLVGQAIERLDLPDKLSDAPRFIHDLSLPGMLFGRVARPPSPAAQWVSVDWDRVKALPGVVATLQDGRLLGVVAQSEYAVVQALKVLQAATQWQESESLPDAHALNTYLRTQASERSVYAQQVAAAPLPATARSFSASYSRPYLAHASIGPSCALAQCNENSFQVWTHSQGIYALRADLAKVLELPPERIVVQHVEGAGCYGHNGADDVACDAALLARTVPGQPVQVQWTREDELSWAPLGAAMSVEMIAEVNAQGRITRWAHEVWSNGHSSRPGRAAIPVLLGGGHRANATPPPIAVNMPLAVGGGAERNSVPIYDFPQWQAVSHRLLTMPLRTSALRSLGAHCNVFASESFMDEIAQALELDPLEFRLNHLQDARARAVLQKAVAMSPWQTRSKISGKEQGRGLGLGVSRYKNTGAYCAVVAAVNAEVDVRVTHLWIAVDAGEVINPDGLRNQIEGGAIQTVSWVLKEAVQFDRTRVTSSTWETYPILRFSEVPKIEIEVIEPKGEKSLGAGEATHGPVAAAIANALNDALGVRVRDMPLSTEAVTQAVLSMA